MTHVRFLLIGCLLLAGCEKSDAPRGASTAAPADGTSQATTDPDVLLERMGTALQNARTIQGEVDITAQFESVPEPMKSSVSLVVERPKKMAVRYEGLGGMVVVANGEQVSTHVPALSKYMQEPQEGDLDEVMEGPGAFIKFLPAMGLVGALLGPDVRSELLDGVTSRKYVARVELDGASAHHLAFEQERIQWELWLSADATPLPLKGRVRMSTGSDEHSVAMDLRFRNWRLDQTVPADAFAFTPPANAEKVDSLFGEDEAQPHPMLGKAAPDFKLPLLGGGEMSLAAHRDKQIVVLDFWATWCGPCVQAMPVLQKVSDAFRDRGVVLYAVNQEESDATLRRFLEKHTEIKLPIPLDADGRVAEGFGVSGLPTTVIVGKDGRVQVVHEGYSPGLRRQLTKELNQLVDGKDLAAASKE